MTHTTIYHNPQCGTSRNVLALLRHCGIEPTIIEYLQNPPSRAELQALLQRILAELSTADREAIVCCDLEGLPQAEYAARVGLGLSAAKSRLQRARQRLRAHMTAACQVQFDQAGHIEDFVPRFTPVQKP